MYIVTTTGVKEAHRAIYLFIGYLKKQFEIEIKEIVDAECKGCYKQVVFECKTKEIDKLLGVHMWLSQSPFRPKHRRKRWYFKLAKLESIKEVELDISKVEFVPINASKNGGQNVNKNSTGIKAIYKELNIEAISIDERSQKLNKKIALNRLQKRIKDLNQKLKTQQNHSNWQESKELRDSEVELKFVGEEFRLG